MNYRLAIFDLDGTLVDSINGIAYSMNKVLEAHGFPLHSEDTYKGFVGEGRRRLVVKSLPDSARSDDQVVETCFRQMSEEYPRSWNHRMSTYDGMYDLLRRLQKEGILIAMHTNKTVSIAGQIAESHFSEFEFADVIGIDSLGCPKPQPDGVFRILETCGLEKSDCVYIGDTEIDIRTAGNAGIDIISVGWGFRSEEALVDAGARVVVDSPMDIFRYFQDSEVQ